MGCGGADSTELSPCLQLSVIKIKTNNQHQQPHFQPPPKFDIQLRSTELTVTAHPAKSQFYFPPSLLAGRDADNRLDAGGLDSTGSIRSGDSGRR